MLPEFLGLKTRILQHLALQHVRAVPVGLAAKGHLRSGKACGLRSGERQHGKLRGSGLVVSLALECAHAVDYVYAAKKFTNLVNAVQAESLHN